jgi:hypothetical protein
MENELETFRREALAVEAAMESDESDDPGNEHAEAMNRIAARLRAAGRIQELLFLLNDASTYVRLWAAAHTIDVDTARAKSVLQAIAQGMGAAAFQAEFVLDRWEAGELESLR